MRRLTAAEVQSALTRCNWATICTVSATGEPYAIEATPFHFHDETCFMINPRGGTWHNMQHSNQVLLKYTLAAKDLSTWVGVSCFGTGRFVTDPDLMREGWRQLGLAINQDYSQAADKFARNPKRSPMLAVCVHTATGRCNAPKEGSLVFPK